MVMMIMNKPLGSLRSRLRAWAARSLLLGDRGRSGDCAR